MDRNMALRRVRLQSCGRIARKNRGFCCQFNGSDSGWRGLFMRLCCRYSLNGCNCGRLCSSNHIVDRIAALPEANRTVGGRMRETIVRVWLLAKPLYCCFYFHSCQCGLVMSDGNMALRRVRLQSCGRIARKKKGFCCQFNGSDSGWHGLFMRLCCRYSLNGCNEALAGGSFCRRRVVRLTIPTNARLECPTKTTD
jgi:hypothetical protein